MAGEHIRVEYDILEEFVHKFGNQADLTETLYSRLFQQMEELRGGSWIGVGADAFYEEMEVLVLPSVEKLYVALQESMIKFRQISEMFEEMEAEAALLFSQDFNVADTLAYLQATFPRTIDRLINFTLDQAAEFGVEQLVKMGAIKLAGQFGAMATTQAGFESVLNHIGSNGFATTVDIIGKVGGGVAGGLIDFAMGDEFTGQELLVQTTSGVVQNLLLPPQVTLVNSGVQIVGNLMAEGAIAIAPAFENSEEIIGTAGRLQVALDAADVDARIDGVVESVIEGDFVGVAEEGLTFLWGVGGTVVEGGTLIGQVGSGAADWVADNTQIDESVGGAVDWAGDRATEVINFFGF